MSYKTIYLIDLNDNSRLYFVLSGPADKIAKLAEKIKNDGGNYWINDFDCWHGYTLTDALHVVINYTEALKDD